MSQHPITLTGRLTETPTLSKINTDMYKVTFRVASSKRRKTDQGWNDFDPLFIGVEAWGQFAINIRASLEKGMPVVVVGSLCSSEWQDRETGQNRSRIVIKAQYVGLDLNHHVIGSKRIAVTHNLAGVNMGDTDEQEFPIDRDFTVPDSAALGDATSAENSSPAAVGDSAADSAADRRAAAMTAASMHSAGAAAAREPEPETEPDAGYGPEPAAAGREAAEREEMGTRSRIEEAAAPY